jgi:hypothetical protein
MLGGKHFPGGFMSKDATTKDGRPPDIVIAVDVDGNLTMDGRPMALEDVLGRLATMVHAPDPPITYEEARPNTRAVDVNLSGANDA